MNKVFVSITVLLVASVVLISSIPIYQGVTSTSISVENEGAGELRYNLADSHALYNVSVAWGDNDIAVTNGSDVQNISYDNPTILYADENIAYWYDGNTSYLMAPDNGEYRAVDLTDNNVSIQKTNAGLSVTIGEDSPVIYSSPSWAFVASSSGAYGFFEDGTDIIIPPSNRLAVVGSFAGVCCYNNHVSYDLPITMELIQEDNVLSGAKWVKALQDAELTDPDNITIIPLNPGDISITPLDPEPDNAIMAVPTPTYTEGEWGYDLITSGSNNGGAKIVSYSGSGGDMVVPSTVGGYAVKEFGKGGSSAQVFDNTVLSPNSTLTLPEGLTIINSGCSYQCSNIIEINIPDTVTKLAHNSFRSTGVMKTAGATGNTVIIPSNVTELGSNSQQYGAFTQCTKIEYYYILGNLTILGQEFDGCTNLKGIVFMDDVVVNRTSNVFSSSCMQYLNFGNYEITAGVNGVNSGAEIRQGEEAYIDALGYISTVEYSETVPSEGTVYSLINMVPFITVMGLVLLAVGVILIRRI